MKKILGKRFFNRDAKAVAEDLLGKFLVRKFQNGRVKKFLITECEAYDGEKDLACHASKGRTKRTEVMYGQAGRFYIYLCYGMYWMLNIVTGKKGYPAAVLIRGIERYRGPGRLTKTLKIDKNLNGKLVSRSSGLWVEDLGEKLQRKEIKKTSRVGVTYAGPIWSAKKWRFTIIAR
ncbi:MAG: DNA-3-methyladenine glycosylase [bacterium]|nr:DNA-3-methyladenine glycosylase [bacterium]